MTDAQLVLTRARENLGKARERRMSVKRLRVLFCPVCYYMNPGSSTSCQVCGEEFRDPNARVRDERLAMLAKQHNYEKLGSFEDFKRVFGMNDAEAWFHTARTMLATDKGPAKAIECANNALKTNPRFAEACRLIAECHRELGDRTKAVEILLRALDSNPNDAQAYKQIANYLDDNAKAIENLQRALDINPSDIDAWTSMGYGFICARAWTAGIEALEEALQINDRNIRALMLLGITRCCLQKKHSVAQNKAKDYFNKILQVSPDHPWGVSGVFVIEYIQAHPKNLAITEITALEKLLLPNPYFYELAAHFFRIFNFLFYPETYTPDAWRARFEFIEHLYGRARELGKKLG